MSDNYEKEIQHSVPTIENAKRELDLLVKEGTLPRARGRNLRPTIILLQALRQKAGLTQEEVAKRYDMSCAAYRVQESRKGTIDRIVRMKLVSFLKGQIKDERAFVDAGGETLQAFFHHVLNPRVTNLRNRFPKIAGNILRLLREATGSSEAEVAHNTRTPVGSLLKLEENGWSLKGTVGEKLFSYYKKKLPGYLFDEHGGFLLEEAIEVLSSGKVFSPELENDFKEFEEIFLKRQPRKKEDAPEKTVGFMPEGFIEKRKVPETFAVMIAEEKTGRFSFYEELLEASLAVSAGVIDLRRKELMKKAAASFASNDQDDDDPSQEKNSVWDLPKSEYTSEQRRAILEGKKGFEQAKKIYDKYNGRTALASGVLDEEIANPDFLVRFHSSTGVTSTWQLLRVIDVMQTSRHIDLEAEDSQKLLEIKEFFEKNVPSSAHRSDETASKKKRNTLKNNKKSEPQPA